MTARGELKRPVLFVGGTLLSYTEYARVDSTAYNAGPIETHNCETSQNKSLSTTSSAAEPLRCSLDWEL